MFTVCGLFSDVRCVKLYVKLVFQVVLLWNLGNLGIARKMVQVNFWNW